MTMHHTRATGNRLTVGVVRVFTTKAGTYGNPLGIVDGARVPTEKRQSVAAEVGYSETVFIDAPQSGRLQIFTPATELAFAGHPTVGAAWWLRRHGYAADRLVVPAGKLRVSHEAVITRVRARAEWAPEFVWQDMATVAEVEAADPSSYTTGEHYLWAWVDEANGRLRSRMFAPRWGIVEDEATGAAALRLTARLRRDLDITQGQGSRIRTTWLGHGWASIGGRVVKEPDRVLG